MDNDNDDDDGDDDDDDDDDDDVDDVDDVDGDNATQIVLHSTVQSHRKQCRRRRPVEILTFE